MNLLRPFLVATFAFFALSLNAQTQGTSTNPAVVAQYSQGNLDQLAIDLSLTPEQIAEIQNLNERVIQKIQAIQNDPNMDDSRKNEFISGNKQDYKRMMSTILTESQYAAYEDLMKPKAANQTKTKAKDIK